MPEFFTIGVYGDWGSGKSSVVLMLQEELSKSPRSANTLCVVFNGWRFEGYDDAKSALMTTILEELAERKGLLPEVRDAVKALARPTLRHRVQLRPEAELEGATADGVIDAVLGSVPVPR